MPKNSGLTIATGWTKTSDGEDWKSRIRLTGLLGSGCIAQVYKGTVLDKDGVEHEVAVKGERG